MSFLNINESNLVKRVVSNDEQAFKELFFTYKNKLYSFCLRYLKSRELAEEIVQDAFMKVWESRQKLDPEQGFGAYLFRVARNQLLNHLKRVSYEEAIKTYFTHRNDKAHNQTEGDIIFADYERIAMQAIEQLPAQRQLIFKMSRMDGLSHEEISQMLDISPNTVKVQMNKSLKSIRNFLEIYADLSLPILIILLNI